MSKRKRSCTHDAEVEVEGEPTTESSGSRQRRVLRRRNTPGSQDTVQSKSEHEDDATIKLKQPSRKAARRHLSHVNVYGPAFPRSLYEGYNPPLEVSTETEALFDLRSACEEKYRSAEERPEYTGVTLNDFFIYLPNRPRNAFELATLDRLQNRKGFDDLLFDGILGFGNEQRYVQGVQFSTMAIDGYGDPNVLSLTDHICIQSARAQRHDVWYWLGAPAKEYQRFYNPFLWLAQFTKYFVDYLLDTDKVTLNHFRNDFSKSLLRRYKNSPIYRAWLVECGRLRDFRTTVAAHVGYLWKECYSIDDPESGLCEHPIWGEVDPMQLNAIKKRENVETNTIVTPFTYECFRRMYFHAHLEQREVSSSNVLNAINERKQMLGLTPFGAIQPADAAMNTPRSMPDYVGSIDVDAGDVICVEPHLNGKWKSSSSTWYAYVQGMRQKQGATLLDVIWLYEPRDTTLGNARYPFQNELFLSDNCSCGNDAVDLGCVLSKADLTWFATDPTCSGQSGLFVRQTFRTVHEEDTYDFVSLQKSDFQCNCAKRSTSFQDCRARCRIGDTVLVRQYGKKRREDVLEPGQVVDFKLEAQTVVLRQLKRQNQYDSKAPPNELFLTENMFTERPSRIIRKCQVRFFHPDVVREGVPAPYDRGGTGDFYYIITEDEDGLTTESEADSLEAAAGTGVDLTAVPRFETLSGMGIFCGGGNFDRGLEDGGAVEFRYAVDWAEHAIHSYRANVDHPEKTQLFWGSVNDYLARAMNESHEMCIAQVGKVDLISAGSPCPGFSLIQPDRENEMSHRNASLVASVVSYIDFYCPRYCVLENVVSMTHGMGANKDENVFAQIVAAMVALGYQVQQFLMEAWNHGSSQSRSRVFIIASAPGLEPLFQPQHSHGHPGNKNTTKHSLGKSSNGKTFGMRRDDVTPFTHVSPAEATADLPDIGDAQPQLCPAFPDHRTPREECTHSRNRIVAVPTWPRGMGLAQAARQGRLRGEPLEYYEAFGEVRKAVQSKSYARVDPDGLFPTVTTKPNIACGVTGRVLHWNQHRPLSVMELRRAQGYLDKEVIVGSPAQQVVIIGNSVDRKVALTLGLSLRTSWAISSMRLDSLPSLETTPERLFTATAYSQDESPSSRHGHRYRLSEEETNRLLAADPPHVFEKINHMLENRGKAAGPVESSPPADVRDVSMNGDFKDACSVLLEAQL